MTEETKHLWKWFFEWQIRSVRTLWHIINRNAYRRWKSKGRARFTNTIHFDLLNEEEFYG